MAKIAAADVERIYEAGKEPIDHIQWIDAKELNGNDYNPNIVFTPELQLLERNLLALGWVQPIMINPDRIIIDGFHRWRLSLDSEKMKAVYKGFVPCVVLNVDRVMAMFLTIRMNRAKGTHCALKMSEIVRELVCKQNIDAKIVATEIGATVSEVELLMKKDVFEKKDITNYEYSKAWYPAQSTDKKVGLDIAETSEDLVTDSQLP